MELLYISDISQLNLILNSKPELLTKKCPITGDMAVSFEFERLNINFIDEWSLIEAVDIESNWNESHKISHSWMSEVFASTKFSAEMLASSCEQDLIYPFQACLNARTIYGRLFEKFSISKISGYFLPSQGVIRTGPNPTSQAVKSVSQAVLFYMADCQGVLIERLESSASMSVGRIVGATSDMPVNSEVENIHALGEHKNEIVLVVKDGMRIEEYKKLRKTLKNSREVRPIVVSLETIKYLSEFTRLPHYIEKGLDTIFDETYQYSSSCISKYPEIFSNQYLDFQFQKILSEIKLSTKCGKLFSILLDLLKPSVVIWGHEAFTLERALVGIAQTKGIYTIGLLHGGVMPSCAMRGITGISNQILIWNNTDLEILSKFQVGNSRYTKIGSMQYEESYLSYLQKSKFAALAVSQSLVRKKYGVIAGRPLILVTTAEINTGHAAPIADPYQHRNAFRDFLALVDSRPDWQFIIKPHPSFDYYELYRGIIGPERPNLRLFENGILSEMLEVSDICLMINYCTTASLEAMLKKVPVVYLCNAVYPLNDWRDNLSDDGVVRVNSLNKLEAVIDKLLTNTDVKKLALSNADKQMADLMGYPNALASDCFIDNLRNILNSAPKKQGDKDLTLDYFFQEFINNKNTFKNIFIINKFHSYDYLNVLILLTYFAASFNIGFHGLKRMFESFIEGKKVKEYECWKIICWKLYPVYITSFFNNIRMEDYRIKNLRLFLPYFLNPNQFVLLPNNIKILISKFLLKTLLGKKLFQINCRIANKFALGIKKYKI